MYKTPTNNDTWKFNAKQGLVISCTDANQVTPSKNKKKMNSTLTRGIAQDKWLLTSSPKDNLFTVLYSLNIESAGYKTNENIRYLFLHSSMLHQCATANFFMFSKKLINGLVNNKSQYIPGDIEDYFLVLQLSAAWNNMSVFYYVPGTMDILRMEYFKNELDALETERYEDYMAINCNGTYSHELGYSQVYSNCIVANTRCKAWSSFVAS